jgi:hypothetical protein
MNVKRHLSIVSVAALGVVLMFASPALAQHRGGGGSRGGGHSVTFGSGPVRSAGSSVVFGSSQRVVAAAPAVSAPRAMVSAQAVAAARARGPIANGYRQGFTPYYSFRPRFAVGIGLFVGYPVAYPCGYGYYPGGYADYGYPYGYPCGGYPYDPYYGYSAPYNSYNSYGSGYSSPVTDPGYVSAAPAAPTTAASVGGVSLDLNPPAAAVFLDGVYVGVASDFSPTQPPLTIAAGKHRLELRAQGYASLAFDLTVVAGQVTPFQGAMQIK